MKTRSWIAVLAAVFLLCAISSFFLLGDAGQAASIRIESEGNVIGIYPLAQDRVLTVINSQGEENTVTIQNGSVAVTSATCPDGYCMHRGFCTGGSSIVCLPNRLIIAFLGAVDVDISTG